MKQQRNDTIQRVKSSVLYIHRFTRIKPKIAIILGSGLGNFAAVLTNVTAVEASSIPHYPRLTVEGHRGRMVFGTLNHVSVCVLQGRIHLYETGDLEAVLYPIRLMHALGIKIMILTNAAGAINRTFQPADLMLITDQINMTFASPLRGLMPKIRHNSLFDVGLIEAALKEGRARKIPLKQGIYFGCKGPSYETAAEIEMTRRCGADAVGMSTVNEVSLAAALGMRILGISCITNLSTGSLDHKLSHDEVTEAANRAERPLAELLDGIVEWVSRAPD